ncbi:MAG: DNA repair protein RecO [Bacteroidales bacterium]|nr:DNA repair protein RecO [Bacteroidales bacterium]
MLEKTRAIVLHNVKYAESSIITSLYTEQFGRLSCMVNAVRSKRTSFPASFFLPLTILEIDLYHKPGRDLQRIREMSCWLHFNSIPFQIVKSTIALFIAELLYKTIREEESNRALFDFLIHAIQLLDIKEEGIQNFHLVFLLQYMKFLGIYPFLPEHNGVNDNHPVFLLPADAGDNEKNGFWQLAGGSLAQLENIRLTNKTRSYLLDSIIEFYMVHFGQMTGINSLQVLKEVFQ